jgi:hypothetical protein
MQSATYTSFRTRQDERRKEFKKGIDASESRRRRNEANDQIRKNKREELALKRRNINDDGEKKPEDAFFASQKAVDHLDTFVQMIFSNNEKDVLEGTRAVRKIISKKSDPPIDKIVRGNVISQLVQLLECGNETIQFEASWVLTNITYGPAEYIEAIIREGGVQVLIDILNCSPKIENKEQAVWTLGNIAGDSYTNRDYVLKCGVMHPLIKNLNTDNKSFLRTGTWTLSNLVRGKPSPDLSLVVDCLETLYTLSFLEDEEILRDVCWAVSYLTDGENQRIQAAVNAGFIPRLMSLLKSDSSSIRTPSLRAIGNIVTGTTEQTQAALDMGCLTVIQELMEISNKNTLKECCWAISNITAGTVSQIQYVLGSGVIITLLHLMKEEKFEVKKEIILAITNAVVGGNNWQVKYLMENGVLEEMVDFLPSHDCEIVIACLEGLGCVFKVGERMMKESNMDYNPYVVSVEGKGLLSIEALQDHKNEKIYKLSSELIDEYFDSESPFDEHVGAPLGVSAEGLTFCV